MHGGMIGDGALFLIALLLIFVSAFIPSIVVAAFVSSLKRQRLGFFVAAFVVSVATSAIYEVTAVKLSVLVHPDGWNGWLAVVTLVFGPALVSTLTTALVWNRQRRT